MLVNRVPDSPTRRGDIISTGTIVRHDPLAADTWSNNNVIITPKRLIWLTHSCVTPWWAGVWGVSLVRRDVLTKWLCLGFRKTKAPFTNMVNFNPAWISNDIPVNCGMKLLIHSQTSTVAPLKFGMDKKFNPTLYNGCWKEVPGCDWQKQMFAGDTFRGVLQIQSAMSANTTGPCTI